MSVTPYTMAASRPDAEAQRAARRIEAEQRQAEAAADWQAVRNHIRDRIDGPAAATLLALLERHKPYGDEYGITCGNCVEGSYETEAAAWPCAEYETIKDGMT